MQLSSASNPDATSVMAELFLHPMVDHRDTKRGDELDSDLGKASTEKHPVHAFQSAIRGLAWPPQGGEHCYSNDSLRVAEGAIAGGE